LWVGHRESLPADSPDYGECPTNYIVVAAVAVVYPMENSQECTSMVLVYMYIHICKCASKKAKCLVCAEILPLQHQLEKHQLEGINRHKI